MTEWQNEASWNHHGNFKLQNLQFSNKRNRAALATLNRTELQDAMVCFKTIIPEEGVSMIRFYSFHSMLTNCSMWNRPIKIPSTERTDISHQTGSQPENPQLKCAFKRKGGYVIVPRRVTRSVVTSCSWQRHRHNHRHYHHLPLWLHTWRVHCSKQVLKHARDLSYYYWCFRNPSNPLRKW